MTEVHNSVNVFNNFGNPIAIEGRNLKRVYLYIGRKPRGDNLRNDAAKMIMAMLDSMDGNREKIRSAQNID